MASAPLTIPAESKKTDTRQRILDAALRLFAERGFHGTAVPLVAEQAGVGAGTIYRYFASKEELVNEVFRHAKTKMKETLLDGLDLDLPPKELFHTFWARLTGFAQDNPVYFAFLELQDHVPYLDERSKVLELQVLAPIWLACQRLQDAGLLKPMPSEAIMAMVWGALVGLFKAKRLGYIELTAEVLADARDACWDGFVLPAPAP